jgi:muramoyltetrapeptide carboxypeptidase
LKSVLPPALRVGDRIGIAAPGGPIRPAEFERGLAYLTARGYEPVVGRHVRERHGYLAGADEGRLEDLNGFLADRAIRGVWFARGGYGSARIVAGLDLAPFRKDPKPIIGYSDITVVHQAVYRRLGVSTFYGPLVPELGDESAFDEASLWRALSGGDRTLDFEIGPESIHREGMAEGPLVGGCLSLLVSLVGTPYEAPTDGTILFWEEVNEEPYRIDRMLCHLRLAGRLARLRGMIIGRLVGCDAKDPRNDIPLAEILETHLEGTDFPVVFDFPAGHCAGKVTLPLGRIGRLDTDARRLSIRGA